MSWMVPTLTDKEDMALRVNELEVTRAVESAPEAVAALAASLMRQNVLQERIIRNATQRIAELEAREALAERPAPRRAWWRWRR